MNRRALLKTTGAVAGMAALGATGCTAQGDRKQLASLQWKNEHFYGGDGSFDVDQAKDAVLALCKYHGYPIYPKLRESLWVSDYGRGQFTKVGLAAWMFMNNVEDQYMLMDIFLLPGQMLPEHWHEDGESNPAKREGWLIRWGLSHVVGIGEPNLGSDVVIPECHWDGEVMTRHEVVATPGMFVPLARVKSRHWQLAGPEGVILTEVANVHTDSAVRHSDPAMNDFFLGKN